MDIRLVLERNTAEMTQNVLHVGIGTASDITAEVVNPFDAEEKVVDDSDNNSDTNGVAPDDNDGDDGGLDTVVVFLEMILGDGVELMVTTMQPTEDTEEC